MFALVGAVVLLAITHGRVNQLGFLTYVTLWWMHESAKLNMFFGAPNLGEEMLPPHLRYLASYMTRRPMNMFFPISVTVSTVVTAAFAARAASATSHFEAIGSSMLGALMALAVLEHWFLVAPLNANALWGPLSRRGPIDLSPLLEGELALEDVAETPRPRAMELSKTAQRERAIGGIG
jgi:putative photosynthetic complex assembly protein 2